MSIKTCHANQVILILSTKLCIVLAQVGWASTCSLQTHASSMTQTGTLRSTARRGPWYMHQAGD